MLPPLVFHSQCCSIWPWRRFSLQLSGNDLWWDGQLEWPALQRAGDSCVSLQTSCFHLRFHFGGVGPKLKTLSYGPLDLVSHQRHQNTPPLPKKTQNCLNPKSQFSAEFTRLLQGVLTWNSLDSRLNCLPWFFFCFSKHKHKSSHTQQRVVPPTHLCTLEKLMWSCSSVHSWVI